MRPVVSQQQISFCLPKVTQMIPFDITKSFREVKKETLFYKEDT